MKLCWRKAIELQYLGVVPHWHKADKCMAWMQLILQSCPVAHILNQPWHSATELRQGLRVLAHTCSRRHYQSIKIDAWDKIDLLSVHGLSGLWEQSSSSGSLEQSSFGKWRELGKKDVSLILEEWSVKKKIGYNNNTCWDSDRLHSLS